MTFEYKVVPAPTRGRKAKGVKTPAERFAHALEELMNQQAAEGWEYLRTDTLPAEERHGLTRRTTVYQNMLVFRRAIHVREQGVPARSERDAKVHVASVGPARVLDPVAAPVTAERVADASAGETAPAQSGSLGTIIAREVAAARAPRRLPSAGDAQATHATPVKSPTLTAVKPGSPTQ